MARCEILFSLDFALQDSDCRDKIWEWHVELYYAHAGHPRFLRNRRFNWIRQCYALVINARPTSGLQQQQRQPSWEKQLVFRKLPTRSFRRAQIASKPVRTGATWKCIKDANINSCEFASAPNYLQWIISVRLINNGAMSNRNEETIIRDAWN